MIFFLVLFLANFIKNFFFNAAFAFSMAIAAKLLPFIFLPLVMLKMNLKHNLQFITVLIISLLVVFSPLLDSSFFIGIENSLLLYYQKFEFNAGIYYAFRQVGYWLQGYNMIALIGKIFAIGVTLSILLISIVSRIKKYLLPNSFLYISTVFALFSLILHPWYISLVILFSTITNYKFGILWSFLIMGSYAGYSATQFKEIIPFVSVEFILVITFFLFEIKKNN
jgi:hypothetical protein